LGAHCQGSAKRWGEKFPAPGGSHYALPALKSVAGQRGAPVYYFAESWMLGKSIITDEGTAESYSIGNKVVVTRIPIATCLRSQLPLR
jgi:hypothetical protein